jgi:hypothetical protein
MSTEPDPDSDEIQKVEDVPNKTEDQGQPRNPCPICESAFNRKGPQLRTGHPPVQPEA